MNIKFEKMNISSIISINFARFFFRLGHVLFLMALIIMIPVSGLMTQTIPSFPLSNDTIGFFETNLGGGYPLFTHPYAPLSPEEFLLIRQQKNQTLSLVPYYNPPLFPSETVYGIYHQENGYVSWVKEFIDPVTGNVRLCQVGDTGEKGETPYLKNLSPAENDYLGRIGWYNVNGKIWPRTWINGTMYEGQSWSEWWGPFIADEQGSVFKKRDAVVSKGVIPVAGNQTDVYIVTITGPSEFYKGMNMKEVFYFADGIGPVGHEIFEMSAEPIALHAIESMPADAPSVLPAGELVFSHEVRCLNLY
jgi:hypothetical protein